MGGGGSKCNKVDRIDPKPSVTADIGVTIAGSRQCNDCSLTVAQSSSSSVIMLKRDPVTKGMLLLEPSVPLSVNFNGTTAVFNQIALYTPAPTSVEHVNADAVLHCWSDSIWLFIPLKAGDSGPNVAFLSAITGVLDPATSAGLGIVDSKTGQYGTATAAPGQDWSIASLVNGVNDPYFTWVNGKLEQYTISDSQCERHLGWKSTSGPQVIYFQNSVTVSSSDITRLRETIGTVLPADIGLTISGTMYSPGQLNCPSPPVKLKVPKFQPPSPVIDFVGYFVILLVAFLGVVAAVSLMLMKNGPIQYIAAAISRMFDSVMPPPPPPAPAAPQLPSVAGLGSLGASALAGKLPGGLGNLGASALAGKVPGGLGSALAGKLPGGLGKLAALAGK